MNFVDLTFADWTALLLPLFVALDPVGLLPPYIQLTAKLKPAQKVQFLKGSFLVASLVGLLFIPVGPLVLKALGLITGDLQVAGGLLLIVIALRDIAGAGKLIPKENPKTLGVVPFGVPLLVGPAVLATLLLLLGHFGYLLTAFSLAVNLVAGWLFLSKAGFLLDRLGSNGVRVLSKLAALLLMAYAVMMIRVGVFSFLPHI